MLLNSIELNLCDMQGKLFELSAKVGYGSSESVSYTHLTLPTMAVV